MVSDVLHRLDGNKEVLAVRFTGRLGGLTRASIAFREGEKWWVTVPQTEYTLDYEYFLEDILEWFDEITDIVPLGGMT